MNNDGLELIRIVKRRSGGNIKKNTKQKPEYMRKENEIKLKKTEN